MNISEQVKQLEDENTELKAESEHRKNLLIDQNANFRKAIALRDQQLVQAAAELDAADKREAEHIARIEQLIAKLSRYQGLGAFLKECEYGQSPFDRMPAPQYPLVGREVN